MSVSSVGLSNVKNPIPFRTKINILSNALYDSATNNLVTFPYALNDTSFLYSPFIIPVGQSLIITNNWITINNPTGSTVTIYASSSNISETISTATSINGSDDSITSQSFGSTFTSGGSINSKTTNTFIYNNTGDSPKYLYLIYKWNSSWNNSVTISSVNNSQVSVLSL
jgi:hypothetical protein